MKRFYLLSFILSLCMLAGCSLANSSPTPVPTPAPTVDPDMYNYNFDNSIEISNTADGVAPEYTGEPEVTVEFNGVQYTGIYKSSYICAKTRYIIVDEFSAPDTSFLSFGIERDTGKLVNIIFSTNENIYALNELESKTQEEIDILATAFASEYIDTSEYGLEVKPVESSYGILFYDYTYTRYFAGVETADTFNIRYSEKGTIERFTAVGTGSLKGVELKKLDLVSIRVLISESVDRYFADKGEDIRTVVVGSVTWGMNADKKPVIYTMVKVQTTETDFTLTVETNVSSK